MLVRMLAVVAMMLAVAARAEDGAGDRLRAAAEPFETLSEQSFSAKPAQLDRRIAEAVQAAGQVRPLLQPDGQGALDRQLAAIRAARQADDRAGVALASIEGYRVLVAAAPPGRVPTAVALMDYAGFRYDADLKANPPRWGDMQDAVAFVRQQWDTLAGGVYDVELAIRVEEAIGAMESAVAGTSAADGRRAAKSLLDLVDEVEAYFQKG